MRNHLAYQENELLVVEEFQDIRRRNGILELEVKCKGSAWKRMLGYPTNRFEKTCRICCKTTSPTRQNMEQRVNANFSSLFFSHWSRCTASKVPRHIGALQSNFHNLATRCRLNLDHPEHPQPDLSNFQVGNFRLIF